MGDPNRINPSDNAAPTQLNDTVIVVVTLGVVVAVVLVVVVVVLLMVVPVLAAVVVVVVVVAVGVALVVVVDLVAEICCSVCSASFVNWWCCSVTCFTLFATSFLNSIALSLLWLLCSFFSLLCWLWRSSGRSSITSVTLEKTGSG